MVTGCVFAIVMPWQVLVSVSWVFLHGLRVMNSLPVLAESVILRLDLLLMCITFVLLGRVSMAPFRIQWLHRRAIYVPDVRPGVVATCNYALVTLRVDAGSDSCVVLLDRSVLSPVG